MRNGDISAINLPDVSMDRMEFEQFQLIENGSNKGKAVLLSNIGFKYTLSRKTKTTSYWRCYKQAKPNVCPGTVRQKGEIYLNTWRNSGSGAPRFHLFHGHVTEYVRTNNDCESWHSRLNRKAETSGLNLYKLVDLLHRESLQTTLTLRLLTDKKMNGVGKKRFCDYQRMLQEAWNDFENVTIDIHDLMKICGSFYSNK